MRMVGGDVRVFAVRPFSRFRAWQKQFSYGAKRSKEELTMKRLPFIVVLLLVFGIGQGAWAGPEEEVNQVRQQRLQAFNEGNLEVYMATWADNGALTTALTPFRIEGKEAIRDYYAGIFQAFPTRRFFPRQITVRIYGGTIAVTNQYFTLTLVDRTGKVSTFQGRFSNTYVKFADGWKVVDQHTSVLPASP